MDKNYKFEKSDTFYIHLDPLVLLTSVCSLYTWLFQPIICIAAVLLNSIPIVLHNHEKRWFLLGGGGVVVAVVGVVLVVVELTFPKPW